MRLLAASLSLLSLCACVSADNARAPPEDRFYYPTGITYVRSPLGQRVLYVASSNGDKRYTGGTLLAVDLDLVGLPPIGGFTSGGVPQEFPDLKIGPDAALEIATFAGDIRTWPMPDGVRLFFPSRGEGTRLQIVDAQGNALTCTANTSTRNCGDASFNLNSFADRQTGRPAAPEPNGLGISTNGTVVVAHEAPAKNPDSVEVGDFYAVVLPAVTPDGSSPQPTADSYYTLTSCTNGLCAGGSWSAAVGQRYAYLTGLVGRTDGSIQVPANLIRYLDLQGNHSVGTAALENSIQLYQGREVILRPDETRLYLVGRGIESTVATGPSMLIAVDLIAPNSDAPNFKLAQMVPLPERGVDLALIPRAAPLGDLVLVTSSDAGALSVYDDLQGRIVATLFGIGEQPNGLAVQLEGISARIFVAGFTDGQVAVIDMPDIARPFELQLVAKLGKSQVCIIRATDPACIGVSP
jgi:hypothetical protein